MNTIKTWIAATVLISLFGLTLEAQSLAGPSIGFIQDEKGTRIWPLLGILGSSVPGRSLDLPSGIANAVISPNQDYALAVQTDDAQAILIKLDIASPTVLTLPGIRSNAGLISISPGGAAAAFYAADSKVLQVVSGLPEAPTIAYEFDASDVTGNIDGIAVTDDAKLALFNVEETERHVLWAVASNGLSWPIIASGSSRISFLSGRHDAVVADSATHEVFMIVSIDQYPARLPGFVFAEATQPFAGIAASRDGRMIFVAQRGSENISRIDLETGTTAVLSCGCSATGLFPLKGGSVFRLNGLLNGPITVLDASTEDARIVLIPPDPEVLGAGFAQKNN